MMLTQPAKGIVTVDEVNDLLIYTPNADFFGTDNFEYTGCADTDPDICGSASVIVTVNQLPDKPIAIDDEVTIFLNSNINIEAVLNDIDVDEEGLDFTIIDDADHAATTILFGDIIFYELDPAENYLGSDEIVYKICKIGSSIYCDTATISVDVLSTNFNPPSAVNDTATSFLDFEIYIPALLNDFDGDGDGLAITALLMDGASGTAVIEGDSIKYSALEVGEDNFGYVVCDDNFPSLCDTAYVSVDVTNIPVGELVVKVPNSFSPNGDGINDILEIEGLTEISRFSLNIYDRWSNLVYENRNQEKTWNGKSNVELISTSGDVPEGTYYYVLRINGFPDPLSGFIVVKR
jgi:gliding motility-associated-like protein